MNIHTIVNQLLSSGFTQTSLSDAVSRSGVCVSQATISRISKSSKYQPGSDKAFAIFNFYQKHEKTKRRKVSSLNQKRNSSGIPKSGNKSRSIDNEQAKA